MPIDIPIHVPIDIRISVPIDVPIRFRIDISIDMFIHIPLDISIVFITSCLYPPQVPTVSGQICVFYIFQAYLMVTLTVGMSKGFLVEL